MRRLRELLIKVARSMWATPNVICGGWSWAHYGKVGATAKIDVNRVQTHRSGRQLVLRDGCVLKNFSTGPNLSGVVINIDFGGYIRQQSDLQTTASDKRIVTLGTRHASRVDNKSSLEKWATA